MMQKHFKILMGFIITPLIVLSCKKEIKDSSNYENNY